MFMPVGTAATNDSGVPEALPQMLMVVGIVMIGAVLVISVRSKIARKNAERPSPAEHIANLKAQARGREDLADLQAQLYDTAQDLTARLHAKQRYLEQLLADADDRIARLKAAQHGPFPGPAPDPNGDPTPPARAPDPGPIEPPAERPAPFGRDTGGDPLTDAVYALADDGHDVPTIARRLDEQIGKVELILALRGAG